MIRVLILIVLMLPLAGCFSLFPGLPSGTNQDLGRLERAVDINPKNEHAWFLMGKAMLEQDKPGDAADAFEEAIAITPQFKEARLGLGVAFLQQDKWSKAAQTYEALTRDDPRSVSAWVGLGAARLGQNDLTGTEAAARQALAINPDSYRAHRLLGEVAYIRGDYGTAVAQWRLASDAGGAQSELMPIIEDLEGYLREYGD
ncbi:MAG: tetratricopeptide repeat protein [Sumerlaeia bacterium]